LHIFFEVPLPASFSSTTTMSESSGDESTPVVGIFYDSFTSVAGSIAKSKEATVEQTVANLAGAIVKKINSNFSVVPPLSLPKDMLIHYYPPLTGKADIHTSLPANECLITLVTPKSEVTGRHSGWQAGRVDLKYHDWKALNTENKKPVLQMANNEFESASGESTLPLQHLCQCSRVVKRTKNGYIGY
jgi:hypothetical protein